LFCPRGCGGSAHAVVAGAPLPPGGGGAGRAAGEEWLPPVSSQQQHWRGTGIQRSFT